VISQYKDPEAGSFLEYLTMDREAKVIGTERVRDRITKNETRRVMRAKLPGELWVIISTSTSIRKNIGSHWRILYSAEILAGFYKQHSKVKSF
jgi:hypothetical protein